MRFGIGLWLLLSVYLVQGQNNPVNVSCEAAIGISPTDEVTGGFVQGTAYNLACLNETVQGVWFSVTGNGKFVNLNLGSGTGQLQHQFFSGDCGFLQCLGQGNGYVPLKEDSTYYLLIYESSLTVTEDTFLFYFESTDIPVYDNCDTAPELSCGSSLTIDFNFLSQAQAELYQQGWFRVNGANKNFTLLSTGFPGNDWVLSYYGSNCDNGVKENNLSSPVFWTGNVNETYLFSLHDSIGLTDSVQFSLSCVDVEAGQSCATAIGIDCVSTIEDTLEWYGIIDFSHPDRSSKWWTYVGDTTEMQMELKNTGEHTLYWSMMYRGPGSATSCFDDVLFLEDSIAPGSTWSRQLVLLGGYQYYFKIDGKPGSTYLLQKSCDSLDTKGLHCAGAISTICQDSLIAGNILGGMPLTDSTYTEGNGYWYTWDPKVILPGWVASDSIDDLQISILKGNCASLETVYTFYGNVTEGINWHVSAQDSMQEYYVVLSSQNATRDSVALLQSCLPSPCQLADSLHCGDTLQLVRDGVIRLALDEDVVEQNFAHWSVYRGQGQWLTWVPDHQGSVSVYTGNCDSLVLDSVYTLSPNGRHKIFAEENQTYFLVWREIEQLATLPILYWECESTDSTDLCEGALNIDCTTGPILITDLGATPDEVAFACDLPSNTKWLKLTGNGQIITLSGGAMSLFSGTCGTLQCMGNVSDQLRFLAMQDSTYYVAVSTHTSDSVVITPSCKAVASNSSCNTPDTLQCDSTYLLNFINAAPDSISDFGGQFWFQIIGDGSLWSITANKEQAVHWAIKTNTTGCDSSLVDHAWLEDSDTSMVFQWQSIAGENVWIEISSDVLNTGNIMIDCIPMVPGMDCEHAIEIVCGDTLVYENREGHTFGEAGGDTWYKLLNAKDVVHIKALQDSLDLVAQWFYGDGCDEALELLDPYAIDVDKTIFAADQVHLYLVLGTSSGKSGTAVVQVGCESTVVSSYCEGAVSVSCDSIYSIFASHTQQSDSTSCSPVIASQWFEVEGHDLYWTATSLGEAVSGKIFLYQGSCGDLFCIDTFELGSNVHPSFYAPEGSDFKIQIVLQGAGNSAAIQWTCRNYNDNNTCEKAEEITCGETVIGNTWLAPNDTPNGCNAAGQALYYSFTGDGNYLRLNLRSGKAVFNLMEEDCVDGRCIFSQTLGATRHSVLISTKNNQVYYLRVAAPDTVTFSFDLECFVPHDNASCLDATSAECGDSYVNDLQTPVGYTIGHPCIGLARTQHWYYLQNAGQPLVELVPDAVTDSFKILLIRGNCDTYECIAQYSSNDEKIIFNLDELYDYYIAIYGNVFDEGTARFSLQCGDLAVNDRCDGSVVLNCPQSVNVPFYLASPENLPACAAQHGPSLWYQIQGQGKGVELKVTQFSEAFTGTVVIFKGADCSQLTCFYQSPIGSGNLPSYRWLAETGINYYIGMYSDDLFYPGELNFDVNCFDSPPRDSCGGALLLTDGEYVLQPSGMTADTIRGCEWVAPYGEWYQWQGDGKNIVLTNTSAYVLDIKLFAGECGTLQCFYQQSLSPGDQWEQKTQESKYYYLLLSSQGALQADGQKIKVKFLNPTPNDECFGASPLSCGQLVAVRNDNFTEDVEVNAGCDFDHRDKIWYTFVGDGNIRTLKFIIPDVDGSVVFTDGCSQPCFYVNEFYASLATEFSFSTVVDKTYYLGLGTAAQPSNKRLRMQMECEEGYHHTTKEFALPLLCGDYLIDYTDAKINLLNTCGSNNQFVQLYYSFSGDGSDLVLNGSPNPGAFFKVVDDDCISVHDFAFGGKVFKTVAGKKYYFLVSYFPGINQTEQSFNIDYRCDVGTNESANKGKMVVYPNPSSGKFVIRWEGQKLNKQMLLSLFDINGRLLSQQAVMPNEWGLLFETPTNLSPGLYHATLVGENENQQVRIVVIE